MNTDLPTHVDLERCLGSRCPAYKSLESWANGTQVGKEALNYFRRSDSTNQRKHCKKSHSTLLHFNEFYKQSKYDDHNKGNRSKINKPSESNQELSDSSSMSAAASLNEKAATGYVFLAIAIVLTHGKNGSLKKCKAILDSELQINFISRTLTNLLQLSSQRFTIPVSSIGGNRLNTSSFVEVKIRSRVNDYTATLVCYGLPSIIGHLPSCVKLENWNMKEESIK